MLALEARDIRKTLGTREILAGVSFALEAGKACAILGPSGEGKTTLLRCLNLLLPIDAGEVWLQGERIVSVEPGGSQLNVHIDPATIRRRIGMVFQEWNLWPNLTVRENIALAPRCVRQMSSRDCAELAGDLCERVRIADKLDRYPSSLSGGQKQRAAIARALAMNPDVLMLDEVTSALDPILASELMDLLADLKNDGRTLLIVTHHVGVARTIADTVLFLHGGRVRETGSSAILDSPATPELKLFLDHVHRVN